MSRFKYDVFLSFRGADTRYTFTDHLHHALHQAGLRPFLDSEDLEKGQEINRLMEAIENSEMFIPIFSKNYAQSKWCLREIEKMVKIATGVDSSRSILPVFYDIKPADVHHQTGAFKTAFDEHAKNVNGDKNTVKGWREALMMASKLSGYEIDWAKDRHDVEIVEEIVRRILQEVKYVPLNVTKHPIGIERHVREIQKLLQVGFHDVRMVVISGMGGLGKTTLSKAIYNKIYLKFEAYSFVSNIREVSEGPRGLVTLQNQLLCDISKGYSGLVHETSHGVGMMERILRNKKVLIILDDVDDARQLRELAGKQKWFYPGSRVIITTRDERAIASLDWNNTQIYVHKKLDKDQSLQLFSWHAFRRDNPDNEFEKLSKKIAVATDGLPLAIEVLGSTLYGNEDKVVWNEMIEFLDKLPRRGVHDRLKISYKYLNEHAKAIFLDIACFFSGVDKETATFVWKGCEFAASTSIRTLSQKSLLKVTEEDKLEMHGVLRDMGRQIVQEEVKDLGKQTRLWMQKEILHMLKRQKGTRKIEGVCLNLEEVPGDKPKRHISDFVAAAVASKNESDDDDNDNIRPLRTDGFAPMDRLRLLTVNHVNLVGEYSKMPKELKWLQWQGCPLKSLPDDFDIGKVAALDLSYSNIIKLQSPHKSLKSKDFGSLKVLNLSACNQLTTTPAFGGFPGLVKLILDCCHNLVSVQKSIAKLNNLVLLSMANCIKLKELPDSISELNSLKILNLSDCLGLEKLPGCIHLMKSLEALYVANCISVKELPSSIFESTSLRSLDLFGCINLMTLPNSSTDWNRLEFLNLMSCSKLTRLPDCISSSRTLKTLYLTSCSAWEGQSLDTENLERLCMSVMYITQLPDSLGSLKNLRYFSIRGCFCLKELPDSVGSLHLLEKFSLDCLPIIRLPGSLCSLEKLQQLNAVGCEGITELPKDIGKLQSLTHLVLKGLSIEELPDTVRCLTKLEILDLRLCSKLKRLPPSISGVINLTELLLDGTNIEELPESVRSLEKLEVLSVKGCNKLPLELPLPEGLQPLSGPTAGNGYGQLSRTLLAFMGRLGDLFGPSLLAKMGASSMGRTAEYLGRVVNPSYYANRSDITKRLSTYDDAEIFEGIAAMDKIIVLPPEISEALRIVTPKPPGATALIQIHGETSGSNFTPQIVDYVGEVVESIVSDQPGKLGKMVNPMPVKHIMEIIGNGCARRETLRQKESDSGHLPPQARSDMPGKTLDPVIPKSDEMPAPLQSQGETSRNASTLQILDFVSNISQSVVSQHEGFECSDILMETVNSKDMLFDAAALPTTLRPVEPESELLPREIESDTLGSISSSGCVDASQRPAPPGSYRELTGILEFYRETLKHKQAFLRQKFPQIEQELGDYRETLGEAAFNCINFDNLFEFLHGAAGNYNPFGDPKSMENWTRKILPGIMSRRENRPIINEVLQLVIEGLNKRWDGSTSGDMTQGVEEGLPSLLGTIEQEVLESTFDTAKKKDLNEASAERAKSE